MSFPVAVDAISCYKCESYRDFRCLDPFDYQPHIQVNCNYENFVRDKTPVFCEKVTDLRKYSTKNLKYYQRLRAVIMHK